MIHILCYSASVSVLADSCGP